MATIVTIIIATLILFVVLPYNWFLVCRRRIKNGRAKIEDQLKRRHEIVSCFLEIMKKCAETERDVFDIATAVYVRAVSTRNMEDKSLAEDHITSAMKSLLSVANNYPDITSNQKFLKLQQELMNAQKRIQCACRLYNADVMLYNIFRERFPTSIVASIVGFDQEDIFKIGILEEQ